ncbi:MAG: PA14 domain-containing protein, partial [Verrucomicrobiota bacterium]
MKRILRSKQLRSGAWLAALTAVAQAGSFTSDFSNPAQPGLTLVGGSRANGDPYPAVANGVLAITYAENSMLGTVLFNELDPGQAVGAFTVTYKVRIGGGSSEPADGMCLYFGSDAGGAAFGEEGPDGGQGLVIGFDTYNNGDNEAPAVDVKYAGQLVGRVAYTPGGILSDAFSEVRIALKSNGTLDLNYKGAVVFTNLFIPGLTPAAGSFAFGARTGALNANHWVDDLSITTQVAGAPSVPTVQTAPASQTVNEGAPVTFSALPAGTPPFTIQWLRNNEVIAGATSLSYSIPSASAALNGSRYAVRFQNAQGQVTSADAVLTVNADTVAPTLASVRGSESFNTVTVAFSEAVTAASAGNAGNYSIAGLSISGVTVLSPTSVRLTTAAQTPGARYTLTVNNVADLANTPNPIAAGTTREFGAWVLAQGFLKFESFLNIGGTPVQNLLDDPKFQANAPDQSGYVATFDSRGFYPTDATENYGARISGFFTPDASGSYRFFSRSDDASQLFLSGSSDPAGLVQIAEETGCCNGFLESPAAQTSEPVTLNANTRYAIQMLYKEGGGGDYGQVAVRPEGDTTPAGSLAPIAGRFLSTFADPDAATLNVTGNPVSQTGAENTRVTFSAAATGTPAPLVLQWQRAEPGSTVFADLPGAVGASYTTPILKQAADNGAKYRALARVPGRTATSTEATLTVIIDSTPPAIAAA